MIPNLYVLGQRVDVIDYGQAVAQVVAWAQNGEQRYVCVSNVHMVMEGHDDQAFRGVVNGADLVVPDGMPLVWALRIGGARDATRVRGPELMPRLIDAAARVQLPIGVLGGTKSALRKLIIRLQQRAPNLRIVFSYSPPFRPMTAEEDDQVVARLNASGARLLFVGLGCPKQEWWMAEHRDRVQAVLVGIGAAFDFVSGTKKQAPRWMRDSGLEWLHRLRTEPRRLWRRYLRHNPRFVFLLGRELLRKVGRMSFDRGSQR